MKKSIKSKAEMKIKSSSKKELNLDKKSDSDKKQNSDKKSDSNKELNSDKKLNSKKKPELKPIDSTKMESASKGWEILTYKKISLKNPILIEGMPGIGNVGKIVMDILIEETKAELLMRFFSYSMPNSVFVNEENLVDLPKIEMHYKKINNQDYLFLTGDVQPTTERASFEFSEIIVNIFEKLKGSHIVTLGGIGLAQIPETPKVYLTGNDSIFLSKISKDFENKKLKVETKIYGKVGPIMGVSGLLLGMAKRKSVNAYSLLAETYGYPLYVGLKGAKALLDILDKEYNLKLKLEKLDKEITHVDNQIKGIQTELESDAALKYKKFPDVNYIG